MKVDRYLKLPCPTGAHQSFQGLGSRVVRILLGSRVSLQSHYTLEHIPLLSIRGGLQAGRPQLAEEGGLQNDTGNPRKAEGAKCGGSQLLLCARRSG